MPHPAHMTKRNALWIMCDQLRFDYLSCYGHPHLHTPNIDALASRGVRFTQAYVQSPVCGPSRMSAHTGRYMRSHGANWNRFPLPIGQPTLGDHLAELGVRNVLVGKTHMQADTEGMRRLGIDPASSLGVQVSEYRAGPVSCDVRPGGYRSTRAVRHRTNRSPPHLQRIHGRSGVTSLLP
jgi:arylsulfatase A-like enzyme